MEMRLPRSVVEIIDRLESLGYEAYAVGGCVRDTLLGESRRIGISRLRQNRKPSKSV